MFNIIEPADSMHKFNITESQSPKPELPEIFVVVLYWRRNVISPTLAGDSLPLGALGLAHHKVLLLKAGQQRLGLVQRAHVLRQHALEHTKLTGQSARTGTHQVLTG